MRCKKLSQIAGWSLLTLIASVILWSWPEFAGSCLLIAGLMFYVGTAFYLLRPPRQVYLALLYAPGFMLATLGNFFVPKRSKKHTSEWVRTSRTIS